MEKNKLPWLNWLRFLAALLVVIDHIKWLVFNNNISLPNYGNEAVILFFVLSGYLVGGKALERLDKGSFKIKDYIIDRVARILIPLIPALILTFIVSILLTPNFRDLSYLEGIKLIWNNNAVLWSLVYEIIFYMMIACYALGNRIRVISVIIFSLIFTKLYIHYLICWLIGVAVFSLKKEKNYIILGISGILIMTASYILQTYHYEERFAFIIESARISIAIGSALIISQLANFNMNVYISKIGINLAAFSYTLYLVHFPIIHLFTDTKLHFISFNFHSILIFSSVIASCIMTAGVMYFLFERNTDRIKVIIKNCELYKL